MLPVGLKWDSVQREQGMPAMFDEFAFSVGGSSGINPVQRDETLVLVCSEDPLKSKLPFGLVSLP